jgi:hypothetical protein
MSDILMFSWFKHNDMKSTTCISQTQIGPNVVQDNIPVYTIYALIRTFNYY